MKDKQSSGSAFDSRGINPHGIIHVRRRLNEFEQKEVRQQRYTTLISSLGLRNGQVTSRSRRGITEAESEISMGKMRVTEEGVEPRYPF
jgi:hypothetical protein